LIEGVGHAVDIGNRLAISCASFRDFLKIFRDNPMLTSPAHLRRLEIRFRYNANEQIHRMDGYVAVIATVTLNDMLSVVVHRFSFSAC
jgi:hypothetical protein